MIFNKELKTLEEAMKETNVNIVPYSITDIYLYESVIALEELMDKLDREASQLQYGLHLNTKHEPDWITTDDEYIEWSNSIDQGYEELYEMEESSNKLLEMIEDLRGQVIVWTEKK